MRKETINHRYDTYPVRILDIPGWGRDLWIADTTLSEQLLPFINYDKQVNDGIFFYVNPGELDLPDNALIELIVSQL